MKMREVRGSGISAEIGTAGPFGLGTFGTKSSEIRGLAGSGEIETVRIFSVWDKEF